MKDERTPHGLDLQTEEYIAVEAPEDDYAVYLDRDREENSRPEAKRTEAVKKPFLSTLWGRAVVGLLIILVVLAAVVATAGQHTSHAHSAPPVSIQLQQKDLPCGRSFFLSYAICQN